MNIEHVEESLRITFIERLMISYWIEESEDVTRKIYKGGVEFSVDTETVLDLINIADDHFGWLLQKKLALLMSQRVFTHNGKREKPIRWVAWYREDLIDRIIHFGIDPDVVTWWRKILRTWPPLPDYLFDQDLLSNVAFPGESYRSALPRLWQTSPYSVQLSKKAPIIPATRSLALVDKKTRAEKASRRLGALRQFLKRGVRPTRYREDFSRSYEDLAAGSNAWFPAA